MNEVQKSSNSESQLHCLWGKSSKEILEGKLCGPQSWSGQRGETKMLGPADRSVMQPVASHYTDSCVMNLILLLTHTSDVPCEVREVTDLCLFAGFLTFINSYDVKLTTRLQNIFMFTKIAALVVIIIAGFAYMFLGKY
jgi:hypothetical protein